MYGHAGDGNIHTRPLLNPKDADDLRSCRPSWTRSMEVVLDLKGTPSGEHGDGLIRTSYVRSSTATRSTGSSRRSRHAFDPQRHHEPGQEGGERAARAGGLPRNLRYGPDYWTLRAAHAACTSPTASTRARSRSATAAPSARAWWRRPCAPRTSTPCGSTPRPRAKANLLRNIIQGKLDPYDTYETDLCKEVTDYCIECGMCALECPSNVNIPKLMLEAKSKYRAARGGPSRWT